ncbi:N-acetylmuramoyl-L-alanine amidase family protein [Paramagnetospirillum kuznetsovii]|uniref:N-acetylmuramoyl-L-alanine amidase family protein n=1 Tax=Paramagnetospirillum kuznetsovii TaxID=2053833 RepID=UPI002AC33BE2|nr:N-acetylmuramoyl-L-alanine amidase [Paramagnetospirillum kuznetsovii]
MSLAILTGLSVLAVSGAAWAASGSGARLGIHGEGVTRFVMDLSDTIAFSVTPKADPYRIVIEAPDLQWAGANTIGKPWGSVNGMRAEDGRIVLDLRKPALVKGSFLITPRDGMGWRLVVDLSETTREAFMASVEGGGPVLRPPVAKASPPPAPAKTAAPKPQPVVKTAPPPAPVVEEVRAPEPAVEAATPPPASERPQSKIVLTSPNAPPQAPLPLPEPVTASSPVVPTAAPRPLEKPVKGLPMLTAPMPPPPERPVVAQPAPPPPPVPVVQAPPPQPAAPVIQVAAPTPNPPAAPKGENTAKARDGVPVIVIDPGHGGVDPGATGVSGIYEKHITLAMAREMKTALEKNGRYRVHLTRDRDVFIRLRDRVAIARQHGADLFISLHADAVQNPQIRGLSVYTLSQNASDNEAQSLAEKENKADLIAGVDLTHESPDVAGILIDLAQRETMNRSAGFATELVDEVGQEMDLLGNTHRFAGFAVLKAPDVPAVLVEMGYLSNDFEEKQLRQPQYRARLANAMAKAVERYFPPSLKAKRP